MRLLIFFLFLHLVQLLAYNSTQSKAFQRYSVIMHCTNQQLYDWSCKACTDLEKLQQFTIQQNKFASIMAYTGYSRSLDKILLVFRGTIDAINWIEDFSYKQIDYNRCKNCKIHEGFYLSYLAVATDIYSSLESLQKNYGEKQILVAGSSLGGALATVAALEIQLRYKLVSELHTFGCPRVGNQGFSMYLQTRISSIIRVVHNRDVVPHVPFQAQNFWHPANEVLFDEQMASYRICDDSGEDPSCSNSYSPNFNPADHVSYWTKLNIHDIC